MMRSTLFLFSFLILAFSTHSAFAKQVWPQAPLETVNMDTSAIQELEDYLFNPNETFRTHSFVIIRKGKLVYEKYAHGYHKDKKHLQWSVTKSFTNALIGIAVKDKIP